MKQHVPGSPATLPETGKPGDVVPVFTEREAWTGVGPGWCPLFGRSCEQGFSFEWHEFALPAPLDWSRSFHPGHLELCLNLDGVGTIEASGRTTELPPGTWTLYRQGKPPLAAARAAGMLHRFLTVEFACDFLQELLVGRLDHVHPMVRRALAAGSPASLVAGVERLSGLLRQWVEGLRPCPVPVPARETWYRGKAIELAALLLFPPVEGEWLCTRAQRAGRERVDRVQAILRERMREAPTLEELGRLVGCSPFYLSRIFSQATGRTIQQYLRQVRLERAAELLRTGRCNVTEAALEVGYNSLSHFSTAFRETFQCCPGLYPIRTVPTAPGVKDALSKGPQTV